MFWVYVYVGVCLCGCCSIAASHQSTILAAKFCKPLQVRAEDMLSFHAGFFALPMAGDGVLMRDT